MKAEDFNNLTGLDFRKMSKTELKTLVSQQAGQANKRYQNIKYRSDTDKSAIYEADQTGGRFHVKKGMTHKQLVLEAKRIQSFNRSETGTVKGAVSRMESIEKSVLGKTVKEYVKEKKKEARKEAAKKGKKLSKKKRKQIEREGRKLEKELRDKVQKEVDNFNRQSQEEGGGEAPPPPEGAPLGAGKGAKEEEAGGSPIKDEEGEPTSFEEMQEAFYNEEQKDVSDPFENVNDEDWSSAFI